MSIPKLPRISSTIDRLVKERMESAGIGLAGVQPWDMHVHDERLFRRLGRGGSLALGESYVDGWWDCDRIDEFVFRLYEGGGRTVRSPITNWLAKARSRLLNLQNRRRGAHVVEHHYELDTDFYESFLDPYMQYTCGYFQGTDDLATAQEQKLDLICRKLQLRPGDHVLDLGCGWGGLARFAAERYGCRVTGISLASSHMEYAREKCRGLPVEFITGDYREAKGVFDKVVIVGMIEHVGYKNYRGLMELVARSLRKDGLFLLHTIGGRISTTAGDPWLERYIFPNGMLPSAAQLTTAAEGPFSIEDWQNLGPYYDLTLLAWNERFEKNWPKFTERYGDRFRRMWRYYLLSCAGTFRAGRCHLWQIVLAKAPPRRLYTGVR